MFHIAGSIRRRRPEVKDIEIVCYPKRQSVQTDFFTTEEIVSRDFVEALAPFISQTVKGNISGRYLKATTTSSICPGISLDLFLPAPEDYFRILVIRTGSAEFVANVIASAWKRNGWVGAGEHGLRRIQDCAQSSDGKWKVINPDGERPPFWKTEEAFFEWLGLKWVDPINREFKNAINQSL